MRKIKVITGLKGTGKTFLAAELTQIFDQKDVFYSEGFEVYKTFSFIHKIDANKKCCVIDNIKTFSLLEGLVYNLFEVFENTPCKGETQKHFFDEVILICDESVDLYSYQLGQSFLRRVQLLKP
jgi:hypothetical protein